MLKKEEVPFSSLSVGIIVAGDDAAVEDPSANDGAATALAAAKTTRTIGRLILRLKSQHASDATREKSSR